MKIKKHIIIIAIIIVGLIITIANTEKVYYANGEFKSTEYRISEYRITDESNTIYEVDVLDENFTKKETVTININSDVDKFYDEASYNHILVRDMQYCSGISIFGIELIFKKEFSYYDSALMLSIYPKTTEELEY